MTHKSTSLVLRLGITSNWPLKAISTRLYLLHDSLYSLFYYFLSRYSLTFTKLKIRFDSIYIYIYKKILNSRLLKLSVLTNFKKLKNLTFISLKFGISFKSLKLFLFKLRAKYLKFINVNKRILYLRLLSLLLLKKIYQIWV